MTGLGSRDQQMPIDMLSQSSEVVIAQMIPPSDRRVSIKAVHTKPGQSGTARRRFWCGKCAGDERKSTVVFTPRDWPEVHTGAGAVMHNLPERQNSVL